MKTLNLDDTNIEYCKLFAQLEDWQNRDLNDLPDDFSEWPSEKVIKKTKKILKLLETLNFPAPWVVPGPNGTISIEWWFGKRCLLIIEIEKEVKPDVFFNLDYVV